MELLIVAGILLFVALGSAGMLYQRLSVRLCLPRPRELLTIWAKRGQSMGASDYEVIVPRIQQGLRKATIPSTQGRRLAVGALTLNFSDADLSEITNYWKLDAFAHDIGESYRYSCTEARVGNIPSQRMEIFFVAEAGRRDNSPLVRPGRPKEGGLRIEVVLDQPAFSAEKVLTPEPVGAQQNTGDADPTATSLLDPETAPFTDAELHDLVQDWGGSGRGGTGEDTQPAPVQGRLRYGATSVCVITGAGITIGRAPTCDLVLTHKSVSRQHARIYKAAQGWYLSPIDSHRCIINGQTIYEEAPIQEGDSLRFGAISDSYTFEEVQQ